jgi:hypothetical protein
MDRISTFLAMMLVAIMLATLPDVPAQEKVEKGPVPLPADFTTRVFTHRLEGSPTAYIKTDLQISPVLTVPKAAYCVGERVVPAISINSDWYSSVFEAEIRSNANVLSCVVPCTILNRDQPIVWITNADFQAIVDENL